ncbi:DUF1648 domain-containing protein [Weissella confusa]|uniref:DUF1648 domain-containing protein n=1 Tax=Weissella confusa TaxID=1583 RepID=A0A923NHI3_WEICO|nr:DUF1648 domain-containing protein [Weissella confusa]
MPFTKRIIAGSTLITLLPILFGAMLYHRLPDRMPTHFAADGSVTETMPKLVVVFTKDSFVVLKLSFSSVKIFGDQGISSLLLNEEGATQETL